MKRKYIIIGAIVLSVLIVLAIIKGATGDSGAIKVAVEKAQRRTIIETITSSGKIQPLTEVKISSDVSGEIVELHVKEGDAVQAGQLLLKIDPDIYLSALDRVQASLNSSRANLANAKARLAQVEAQFTQAELTFKRSETLWKQGAISQADYENAEAQYKVAKAEVEAARQTVSGADFTVKSAEASLKESQENLQKTAIYAPMSGTISKLNVEKGERVVGTIQMTGTELLRIANLNEMEVIVDVNENDIVRVSMGDTALIEVDAYLKDTFKGIVTEIANSANSQGLGTDQVTNFSVKILLLRDSYKHLIGSDNSFPFRPGMTAGADIQTTTRTNVLSVPIQSVTTRPDSTEAKEGAVKFDEETKETLLAEAKLRETIFVVSDDKAMLHYVTVGIQDDNFIEITEGIADSAQVVIAPYTAISKHLENEKKVKVVKIDELFEGEDKK